MHAFLSYQWQTKSLILNLLQNLTLSLASTINVGYCFVFIKSNRDVSVDVGELVREDSILQKDSSAVRKPAARVHVSLNMRIHLFVLVSLSTIKLRATPHQVWPHSRWWYLQRTTLCVCRQEPTRLLLKSSLRVFVLVGLFITACINTFLIMPLNKWY